MKYQEYIMKCHVLFLTNVIRVVACVGGKRYLSLQVCPLCTHPIPALSTHPCPVLVSLVDNVVCPKTGIPSEYFRRNCVNPAMINVFQRLGELRWLGELRCLWLLCTSACKSLQNTSRDWVSWANWLTEAEGSLSWVDTHSQRDACRICPAQRQGTLCFKWVKKRKPKHYDLVK